jgi:hypothetical protein
VLYGVTVLVLVLVDVSITGLSLAANAQLTGDAVPKS